ncbi:MAG: tyrosine-type recombinase/integrase [Anaerolineae bacterium]|nr:tyrosine-type recombinase/integrase [Anaerolineae bacterium]
MTIRLSRKRERSALIAPTPEANLTFNLVAALPGRASSAHTQRAYFRWIDTYLVDIAGWKPSAGQERIWRMSALPVSVLVASLSAPQFRAWLGRLVQGGHGRQGITQARASITTLASLLAEAGLLDDYTSAAMSNVRPPKAEDGQRPGRWLSPEQIKLLIAASQQIATSDNQALRNHLITALLCTMALRREELAAARWSDLSVQNDRVVLRVHGKGRKTAMIDVPRPVMQLISSWRRAVTAGSSQPAPESALVRRIWKGGRISKGPLTADGIWFIVTDSARAAAIGHVAPHDLRRSVAGALQEAGTPIEKISRLLRHSNVAVTERYLSRLPQRNEGAILMSDMLGLEDDGLPDWT